MPIQITGILFALSAAALNASIGVLSKVLIERGFSSASIAFYKTVLAVMILSALLFLIRKENPLKGKAARSWQAAVCSFLGIFILFFFETKAYGYEDAATVVVILMASAAVSAVVLARIFLKDKIDVNIVLGAALAIFGVYLIFHSAMGTGFNWQGATYATLAGLGYGAFSVCMKKMNIQGGLVFTRQLLIWGAFYLFIPASFHDNLALTLSYVSILLLVALAVLPTILGFFCTIKAIQALRPSQVQVIELSEPLFAALMAYIFLGEVPGIYTLYGGLSIIVGLLFANQLLDIRKGRMHILNRFHVASSIKK